MSKPAESISSLALFAAEMTAWLWFQPPNNNSTHLHASTHRVPEHQEASIKEQELQCQPSEKFSKFLHEMLSTTQISQSVVILSLLFVYRLKLNNAIKGAAGSEYRLSTISLMLANKVLDDHTYTAKTWSEVSRLDLQPLVAGEMELLRGLDFKCHITSDEFGRWLKTLAVQVANRKLKQVSLQYRKQMESRRGSLQLPSPDQLFFLPPLATFSPPLPPYSAAVYNTPPESSSSTFPGSYLARPINTNQRIHSTPLSRSQSNSSPLPTPSAPLIRQEPVMSSSNYSVSSPAYAPSLKRPASAETCEPQPLRRINHIFRSQSTTASTLLPALPPFALPHSHHRHHPSSLFHFSTLSNGISPLNLPPYYSTHSSVAASQYSSSSENSGRHVNRVRPDTEERLAVFASSNPLPSPKSVEGCLGGQENAEEEDEDVFAYSVSPGPKHSHHQHNSIAGVSSTRRQSISYFPPQPHQLQQVQHRQHYGYLPHEIPITTHHPTPAPSPIYSRR